MPASEIKTYAYMMVNENGQYIAEKILSNDLPIVKNNFAYGFITVRDDLRIFKQYRLLEFKYYIGLPCIYVNITHRK